jgi:hypothetical protein
MKVLQIYAPHCGVLAALCADDGGGEWDNSDVAVGAGSLGMSDILLSLQQQAGTLGEEDDVEVAVKQYPKLALLIGNLS